MTHAGTPGMAHGGCALIAMRYSGVVISIPSQDIVEIVNQREPMKQIARNNQNHSQPSRSRDRRVEPCSRTMSGEEGGSSSSSFICQPSINEMVN
ncbi:MAG: hypothetical protein [Circular genetic element sp.]|nr:MAG: hypothetical protein [Circular genetic element sp.]